MASLCGPSNALNTLQKHTSVDRSHQQDRIHTLSSQSQKFRSSSPVASSSQVESEFEQFSGIQQDPRFLRPQLVPGPEFSSHQQQPGLPAWAAEFQNLSLNNPSPLLQKHTPFRHSTPQPWMASAAPIASSSNWGAEFLNQANKLASPLTHSPTLRNVQSHSQLYNQPSAYLPQFNSSPYYDLHSGPQQIYKPLTAQSTSAEEQKQKEASDAAFELAFQQAANWQLVNQHDELDAISTHAVFEEDTTMATEKKESRDVEQDADELAKTAGQLLESLSGNQNRKFENSTFLALMRNLRDKKVKVEGDKMVEVEAH